VSVGLCGIGVGRRPEPVHPGVVDENVGVARLRGQPTDLAGVAEIGRHEPRPAFGLLDLGHNLGPALRITPVHDHLGALSPQLHRYRPPDAGRGPGDQGHRGSQFLRHDHASRIWVSNPNRWTDASAP
jgi:hypothetical protein